MSDLLIRDVEDDLVRKLKTKAEINGTSLQHEAKKALRSGSPLSGEERARLLEDLRQALAGFPKVRTPGAEIVRGVREDEG